ncbi:MAG TPA: helix-turn-helix transcriptional regulator [Tepidisphaeraceae bacterium]|nr:helix-turn-helix transcriptional regulator [Tepidisphaeraceae bacterium]
MRGTDFTRRFGERLRVLRVAKEMSQEQLADAAGLHRTHVSLIERNHRSVRLESLERLANALGVEPSELLPTASKPKPKAKRHDAASPRS